SRTRRAGCECSGERWSVGKGLRDYADGSKWDGTHENGHQPDDGAGDQWRYDDESLHAGALVPIGDSENLPAVIVDETGPVVIPGTGVSMGNPFIKRRERPLTIRLGMLALMCCILVTGLFAVTPL